MTTEDTKSQETTVLSPLFSEYTGDENGGRRSPPAAKKIAGFRVYRLLPPIPGGQPKRTAAPNWDWKTPGGDDFRIDPFRTTEADLADQFGGGEVFIQALDENNSIIAARTIPLAGKIKYRCIADMVPPGARHERTLNDDVDGDREERETFRGNGNSADHAMFGLVKEIMKRQGSDASERMKDIREIFGAQSEGRDEAAKKRDEMIDDLRKQVADWTNRYNKEVAELKASHNKETEDLRSIHRDDIRERDKKVDEERDTYRMKIRGVDNEIDAIRRRSDKDTEELKKAHYEELDRIRTAAKNDIEEIRRRYDREIADERSKRERDVAEAFDRATRRMKEQDQDLNHIRESLEETRVRITELEKENIELRQELADSPREPDAPEAPSNGGGEGWMANPIVQSVMQRVATAIQQPTSPEVPAALPPLADQPVPFVQPSITPVMPIVAAAPTPTAPVAAGEPIMPQEEDVEEPGEEPLDTQKAL